MTGSDWLIVAVIFVPAVVIAGAIATLVGLVKADEMLPELGLDDGADVPFSPPTEAAIAQALAVSSGPSLRVVQP